MLAVEITVIHMPKTPSANEAIAHAKAFGPRNSDTPATPVTPVTIVTHSGIFHADDVFGVAVLQIVFPSNTLVRSRDPAVIADADFAVDVGGVWDTATGRFDHHQRGFSGCRMAVDEGCVVVPNADGVAYASAGLVWAAYGAACVERFCRSYNDAEMSAIDVTSIADAIDRELVVHLDLVDNGVSQPAPGLFGLAALIDQLNTDWLEDAGMAAMADPAKSKSKLKLQRFEAAVKIVRQFLRAAIHHKAAEAIAAHRVRTTERRCDGRVLVFTHEGMPWVKVVCEEMPEVLFVVYPDGTDDLYRIHTVPVVPGSYTPRADMPRAWSGLRDADLVKVSGVADAVFCHANVFTGGAKSLAGAMQMAEVALSALR